MKTLKTTIVIMLMVFLGLTTMSCKDNKQENSTSGVKVNSNNQNNSAEHILADYMSLKDALVATDEKAAGEAGKKLENTLQDFNVENYTSDEQEELKDIIEVATEHAEHISRSDIDHQREHFEMLSKDITDMVEITGTEKTLYLQFCPMYADDGAAWLSMEEEIRNPYFGDKMMNCGGVQKEIN